MALLSRKGLLAIAAVIDVALYHRGRPVSAKALAVRHALPARHLEPVLQALVRDGILKGIRGPRGGYELARERKKITADDILRAAGTIEEDFEANRSGSALLNEVVQPAVAQAERTFSTALARINVDDLVKRAERFGNSLATGSRKYVANSARCTLLQHHRALRRVHDLDSSGAIPLGVKVPMIRER